MKAEDLKKGRWICSERLTATSLGKLVLLLEFAGFEVREGAFSVYDVKIWPFLGWTGESIDRWQSTDWAKEKRHDVKLISIRKLQKLLKTLIEIESSKT